MEIVQRRELWIHTHFVTDCVRLSHMQCRDIEAALLPVLRQYHTPLLCFALSGFSVVPSGPISHTLM
jgi:hypothetical protein